MKTAVIRNDRIEANHFSHVNREALQNAEVFTISVMGGPGCGKTTLIDATIEKLMPDVHVGVVACDVVSSRDADRMARHSDQVVQINTGEGRALKAAHIHEAINALDLNWIDLLIVENVGSLTNPASNDIGQDVTVAIFSVAGGDDKADKHPDLVRSADIILINKIDLLGRAPFNVNAFRADVKQINERVEVIEISALKRTMDHWFEWLGKRIKKTHDRESHWFG
jgi:hydrogenase nickel incorporation protein HypB